MWKGNPILLLLLLLPLAAMAQESKKIYMEADMQYYDENLLPGVDRFIGNVKFTHENTVGYCDSAYSYTAENYMIAFGNPVRIYSNDTIQLFGNKVYYDGETKKSTIVDEVVLTDKNSTLYSDTLIYDNDLAIAYFVEGGRLVNNENVLTSINGIYDTKTEFAHFKDSVKLVNETYTMTCDSLEYDSKEEIAYFISRTFLVSEENSMYTSDGWYNMKTDLALLIDDVILNSKEHQLCADTVHYNKNESEGIAHNNVTIKDTVQGVIIKGEYAEYKEFGGYSMVTDSAHLIYVDQDSLFLHADTLRLLFDTLQNPLEVYAFHHVKFFQKDIQGVCDSMVYHIEDSLLTMYYNPVLWSGENQLSADTVRFFIIDSANAIIRLYRSSFITSHVFDQKDFNQIKGINLVGYIEEGGLQRVDVLNNAESIYYVLDEDTALIGVNVSAATELRILLDDNKIDKIVYYDNPEGVLYPDAEFPEDKRFLKGFRWLDFYRPKDKYDIFHTPIPREKENNDNNVEDNNEAQIE